jgi:rubrerythrin
MSLTTKIARVVCHAESDSEETYECKDCGTTFTLDRQTCPDCDCCRIDRIDWDGVVSE